MKLCNFAARKAPHLENTIKNRVPHLRIKNRVPHLRLI